jgi:cytidyltransferase-like protein
MKIAIVSGGFDPIHVGHVELLNKASRLAEGLVVILNTDEFLTEKKGKPFMKFEERKVILENIRCVDLVIKSIDTDQTVCKTLQKLAEMRIILPNGEPHEHLLFCNGGDRTNGTNSPEHITCERLGIESVYGLGNKIQSSSWLTAAQYE